MNNEEKILTMLETIIAEQQQTNHRLDKLETKVEKLETKVEKLDFKIDKLDSGVGNMEADITETKHRVIIIENEHGQKLGALFDSYQLLYEVSGEIRFWYWQYTSCSRKQDFNIKWLNAANQKTS